MTKFREGKCDVCLEALSNGSYLLVPFNYKCPQCDYKLCLPCYKEHTHLPAVLTPVVSTGSSQTVTDINPPSTGAVIECQSRSPQNQKRRSTAELPESKRYKVSEEQPETKL